MPPSLTIDDIWSGTQGKHEIQNQVLIEEKTTSMNGFEVREAVYEAEVRGQKVVYHDMFLFQDSIQMQMSLNAARDVYGSYLGDFRAAVGSVRPLSDGD
jgi:hypothetical protein